MKLKLSLHQPHKQETFLIFISVSLINGKIFIISLPEIENETHLFCLLTKAVHYFYTFTSLIKTMFIV